MSIGISCSATRANIGRISAFQTLTSELRVTREAKSHRTTVVFRPVTVRREFCFSLKEHIFFAECSMEAKMLLVYVLLAVSGYVNSEPTWQSLRVTWGVNLLSSRVFSKLPLTENKARSEGFAKLAGGCSGGKFLGHRYMKGLDTAAVLLYDVNGYIAGIQFGIPKGDIHNLTLHNYEHISAYQHDKIFGEEEVFFLTAYFVDPSIICSGGRTREQYLQDGTGTGLYLQNGSNPLHDSKPVPLYEKDMEGTKWVKGGCFRSMGVHYWYDMKEDMECNTMFPFTAIYNRGKLTNFAFIAPGHYEFSKRFEHPSQSSLSLFLPSPIPKCIVKEYETAEGYSSMHVYFTVRPWNLIC